MNRTELEIKLSNDRAWALETFAAMSEADLHRELKASRHNPESKWTAKDHFAHLIGVEIAFNQMIKTYLESNQGSLGVKEDGSPRSLEEIMTIVHEMNENWVTSHHQKSFNELVVLGQRVRSETLSLLANLTDDQLKEKIPHLPFPDPSIAGILALNGDHARQHYKWVSEALTNKE
jgi:hypothetical protein